MHKIDYARFFRVKEGEIGKLADNIMSDSEELNETVACKYAVWNEQTRNEKEKERANRRIVTMTSDLKRFAGETVEMIVDDREMNRSTVNLQGMNCQKQRVAKPAQNWSCLDNTSVKQKLRALSRSKIA